MNRVLQFLQRPCPHCQQITIVAAQLAAAQMECSRIEALAGSDEIFEFWVPGIERYLAAEDPEDKQIKILIGCEPSPFDIDVDIAAATVTELRKLATVLQDAATRIEGQVSL